MNYLKSVENFLIKKKGWIPVLMGLLIDILGSLLITPLYF